nr:MAG TPA: tail fiber protein [Caudoviricetes sp.]
MPTNNFKLFDQNKANLLSDTEYANATQRLNGVQTGVASSQLNNKFAYQVSLVAYAIAQIMNQNGLDASDALAVSAFIGNLSGSLMQKVADKATEEEAVAGVLTKKYISPATMKAAALLLSGGTMNGVLDMGNNRITNVGTPAEATDAVTKGYVDKNTPILMYEDNFENVDGEYLTGVHVGVDCSPFINTNRKIMVAEGVVTKVSKAINTSSQYYDNLTTSIVDSSVKIASFDKSQTLENITNKNRNVFSSNCIISNVTLQGDPVEEITFGFLTLDTSYKVKKGTSFRLKMSHGTITGTSGYFRVWLI